MFTAVRRSQSRDTVIITSRGWVFALFLSIHININNSDLHIVRKIEE